MDAAQIADGSPRWASSIGTLDDAERIDLIRAFEEAKCAA